MRINEWHGDIEEEILLLRCQSDAFGSCLAEAVSHCPRNTSPFLLKSKP